MSNCLYHKILVRYSSAAVNLKMGEAVLGLVTFYSIWQVCSMPEMHCFLVQSSDPEGKPGFSGRLLQLSEQKGYCLILFFELCIGYKLLTPVFQEHSGGPGGCLLKDFQ